MKKRISFRIGAVILAVLICMTAVACVAQKTPMERVNEAIDKSMLAAEQSQMEAAEKAADFLDGGSMEFGGSLKKLLGELVGVELDMDASAKMYFDTEKSAAALEAVVSAGGSPLVDLTAMLNGDYAALTSDTLLAGESYGITFADVAEKFDSSIFGPEGAYSIGVDLAQTKAAFEELIASAAENTMDTTLLTQHGTAFSEGFSDCLTESLEANAEMKAEKGTAIIEFHEHATTDVIMDTDAEGALNILIDVLRYIDGNEDLAALLAEMDRAYAVVVEGEDSIYSDLMEELDIPGLIEELEAEKVTAAEEGYKCNFRLMFRISEETGELIGVNFHLEDEEDNGIEMYFDALSSPAASEERMILVDLLMDDDKSDDVEPLTASIDCQTIENSDARYAMEIALNVDADDEAFDMVYSVEWNKESGDLAISFTETETETMFAFNGNLLADEDMIDLTLGSLTVDGGTLSFGDLHLILRSDDPMPAIETYTELLDMTEEDVDAVLGRLFEAVGSLGLLG